MVEVSVYTANSTAKKIPECRLSALLRSLLRPRAMILLTHLVIVSAPFLKSLLLLLRHVLSRFTCMVPLPEEPHSCSLFLPHAALSKVPQRETNASLAA